jgi:LPXTG-site transpeptidase (sortase) family protein
VKLKWQNNQNSRGWWLFVIKPLLRFGASFFLIFGGVFILLSQLIIPSFLGFKDLKVITPMQDAVISVLTPSISPMEGVVFRETPSQQAVSSPQVSELAIKGSSVTGTPGEFYLSIPSLGINLAQVEANSLSPNPDFRLGHYRGSSLPGSLGTAFIYGHSALPWFFSPTNYKTIFSTLPGLSEGDKFTITYNDLSYDYSVMATKILLPEEVDPLHDYGADYNCSSSAVLMTCYPPGLSTKRLLIVGKLIF